jgi:hypothetical protein
LDDQYEIKFLKWFARGCWYHHSGLGTLPNANKFHGALGTSPKLNMLFLQDKHCMLALKKSLVQKS